jgi:hypothetical protein
LIVGSVDDFVSQRGLNGVSDLKLLQVPAYFLWTSRAEDDRRDEEFKEFQEDCEFNKNCMPRFPSRA